MALYYSDAAAFQLDAFGIQLFVDLGVRAPHRGFTGLNEFAGLIFGLGSIFKQRAIFYFWTFDFWRNVRRGLCVYGFHLGG